MPDIYPDGYAPSSSLLPSSLCSVPRKPPTDRRKSDELPEYCRENEITDFDAIDESLAPPGFSFKRYDDRIIYFRVDFETPSGIPEVTQSIVIYVNFHVKLYYKSAPIPLPECFRQGQSNNCKLTNVGQLENFPPYIHQKQS